MHGKAFFVKLKGYQSKLEAIAIRLEAIASRNGGQQSPGLGQESRQLKSHVMPNHPSKANRIRDHNRRPSRSYPIDITVQVGFTDMSGHMLELSLLRDLRGLSRGKSYSWQTMASSCANILITPLSDSLRSKLSASH